MFSPKTSESAIIDAIVLYRIILPAVNLYWAVRKRQQGLYLMRSCYKYQCAYELVAAVASFSYIFSIVYEFCEQKLQVKLSLCIVFSFDSPNALYIQFKKSHV